MDLRQLRYFAKVAELGSFTAAAGLLHVSQPALGMQIKKLEDELGVVLLQRHSRGVSTTSAGKLLLVHANEIFDRFELALQSLQQHRDGRGATIRIGVTPSVGRALATTLLEHCTDQIKGVEVVFVQGVGDELPGLVRSDKLDLAFSDHDMTGVKWRGVPLYIEEFHLVGAPHFLSDAPDPISFADLVQLPLVIDGRSARSRDFLARVAEMKGLTLNDAAVTESINIRREMVARGHRCTLSPYALFADELRDGRLACRHVSEPWTQRTIYLNFRRNENGGTVESEVRALIFQLVDERIASGELRWMPVDRRNYNQTI